MALDANQPSDQVLVSELASYIRANRSTINSLSSGVSEVTATTLSISAGSTSLTIGTDLSDEDVEVVFLTSLGASIIANIVGGSNGQIKIFIFGDNDVSFVDGLKAAGALYLNHLPALSNFDAQQDDVIALVNVGGDGDSNYGYWKELWRQVSVK